MTEIKCKICDNRYFTYLSKGNKKITCSKECHSELKRRKMKGNNNGFKKGMISLRKGVKHSKETKLKMSIAQKGNKYCLGKKWTKEELKHRSDGVKKAYKEGRMKHMEAIWKETAKRFTGKGNPNWNNGSSFESYGKEFNNILKEFIRKRDNYKCQECNYTEKKLGYKLSIHHIDYDKKNNKLNNLISLCKSCHAKTNFNRKDWQEHYTITIS